MHEAFSFFLDDPLLGFFFGCQPSSVFLLVERQTLRALMSEHNNKLNRPQPETKHLAMLKLKKLNTLHSQYKKEMNSFMGVSIVFKF